MKKRFIINTINIIDINKVVVVVVVKKVGIKIYTNLLRNFFSFFYYVLNIGITC